ncbi:MAG: hypothetical protein P8J02_10610 [Yoonia sp.]|nr:hypothetical protein [Yoonia sp.]
MSTNLSGPWKGRCDYDKGGKPVAFELQLVDVAGVLSGQITEPNTIAGAKGDMLMAAIEGGHDGAAIRFVKYYSGLDQGDDPVYEGQLNATGTRASRRWSFPTLPGWGGRFVLIRAVKARVRRRISVAVTVER